MARCADRLPGRLKNHFDKGQARKHWHAASRTTQSFDEFVADPAVEQVHFIGKDIVYFHTLFWPAMLQFSGRKTPSQVNVHGFITVNSGEKMSKSRGTGIDPLKYLSLGMNPEWLRYYIAAKLNGKVEDVDFNARRLHGARQRRPDRQVREHREPRGEVRAGRQAGASNDFARLKPAQLRRQTSRRCTRRATTARPCARSWPSPTR